MASPDRLEHVSWLHLPLTSSVTPPVPPSAATCGGLRCTTAVSAVPGTVLPVSRRIAADAGVTQVVKLRLEPTPAQEQLLRSYCGTARRAWNCLLLRVTGSISQRAAERSYGVPDELLTGTVSWHKYNLERLLRENRDTWVPWHDEIPYMVLDRTAHNLAAALASWKAGRTRFPRRRRLRGPNAGLVPVTFKEKDKTWLTDGGRRIALPLAAGVRKQLGPERAKVLSSVLVVKDDRGRRAAKLLRDDRGQVQEVTFSHSGGYWWVAVRMRVLPAAATQPSRRAPAVRPNAALGLDAGMGTTFATLSTPIAGITDETGKIAAPRHLRRAQRDLAEAQAWLQRTEKHSRRHAKALRRVQKLHGRVAGRRETFHHQLAIALLDHAHVLGVEDLNLAGMARRKKGFRFGRSVADNGWGQFLETLERQAVKRGGSVVKADRFYPSSKTCSACGAVKAKLPLSMREYDCTACGARLDRDVNAAANLASLALRGAPPGALPREALALTA